MVPRKPPKRRVLVIDSSERIRRDIKALIEDSGEYEVVGEASTLAEAIQLSQTTGLEIAMVDLEMTESDGLSVLRDLRAFLPPTVVVVATHTDWEEYDAAARAAGAVASIPKERLFERVLPALEDAKNYADRPGNDGCMRQGSQKPRRSSGKRSGRKSSTTAGIWWRPKDWGEWIAGVGAFNWALLRGAPMDSSPPPGYWRYVEAAMVCLVFLLLMVYVGGGFDQASGFSKALILAVLLVLSWAEIRRIRLLSSSKRTLNTGKHSPSSLQENNLEIEKKGGD